MQSLILSSGHSVGKRWKGHWINLRLEAVAQCSFGRLREAGSKNMTYFQCYGISSDLNIPNIVVLKAHVVSENL